MKYLFGIVLFFFLRNANGQGVSAADFLVKPYLQIGNKVSPESIKVLWHVGVSNDTWQVEYKNINELDWKKAETVTSATISVGKIDPFKIYNASFNSLSPGHIFYYRLLKNGKIVFNAEGKSLKSSGQAYRIAISGDMGAGNNTAKKIAYTIFKSNPDMLAIAGDIVYQQGLISEYTTKFWPVYNQDIADSSGAPLMRCIPFVAAVGNHDAMTRDLDRYPDALAYYHFWDQPLNGPEGKEGGAIVPTLTGSDENKQSFYKSAGDRYPRMTNFSFNYGNAHWTVIDSDPYVDWSDSTICEWLAKDLAAANDATWRFVLFHHPGFNSSKAHFSEQQMRLIAPILEEGKVDIVFSGHVHNYQRSFPMTFIPDNRGDQLVAGSNNMRTGKLVNGSWNLDLKYNGKKKTTPKGVIYIVTGAGGQGLYNPEQSKDKNSWQKFTVKFESRVHSFTVLDVKGNTLFMRQLDINGKEIDKIRIRK